MSVVSSMMREPLLTAGATLVVLALAAWLVRTLLRSRDLRHEVDRLHDEIWELREASAAAERAEAANEAKSRFLATVSHEVRTPLNGILGMAELLAGTPLEAEQTTYVAAIRSSGSALASLIDEILDFSKIEAGKLELEEQSFDLVALVEGLTELLAPRAHGKALEIAATVAADVPTHVIGDPVRLRQILLNLAGNAVKFTETGGVGLRVTLADRDASLVRFDVVDTGPGVPADRRAAIFEDFEQADSSTTRHHEGTGLGLAISKRLAEHMGGTLTLEPQARGSLFSVMLPLQADAPGQTLDSKLKGQTALLVSPSLFEVPFLAERLSEAGLDVRHVESVAEAERALAEGQAFDVAIVDCTLGEGVARTLVQRAQAAGTRRTLLLFSPLERRALGPTTSFDGWLVKPVRKASLFALLTQDLPEAPPTSPVAFPSFAPSGTFTVLLAEDNEINALVATRHLQKLGATVTHVPDGLAAITVAEAALDAGTPYDALVLDIRMPGLDGLEVARRFRLAEKARDMAPARLVALSADLYDAEKRSACQVGIDAYLQKPMTFTQLEAAVRPSRRLEAHALDLPSRGREGL